MIFTDPETQFPVADPETRPITEALHILSRKSHPSLISILATQLESMILSVSGWRKIFANVDSDENSNSNEESFSSRITPIDTVLSGIIAAAYADHMKESLSENHPVQLMLGMDTRPTGPAIADSITRILLAKGIQVKHLFITAAPELMAYSAMNGTSDGFIYITASHNPVGYNGIKFGRDGGVIDRDESAALISRFRKYRTDPELPEKLSKWEQSVTPAMYLDTLKQINRNKFEALDTYRKFTIGTTADTEEICSQDQLLNKIRDYAENTGLGIVAELNGSARTCSIDVGFLKELGIKVHAVHAEPGDIAHRIIPEGISLDECKTELEKAYTDDPSFLFGYVPDNDGDRGNIVYIDKSTGSAYALEAQEVFALAVMSELAYTEFIELTEFSELSEGRENSRRAVVVNGPTSMRIDIIAQAFGAEVFRSEVGEANAVNLAKKLRKSGYTVRILGEGSNGGNITHPSSVRDPLNTLLSCIKLMAIRDGKGDNDGLFRIWCERSGQPDAYSEHFTFPDILKTLPQFTTTGVSEERAVLRIRGTSQAILKAAYENLFLEQWKNDAKKVFNALGIASWKEVNTEGIECREGTGKEFRTGSETGGLKIIFYNTAGEATDFIWMRGSGTEPVFRVLADCRGADREREKILLNWHTNLVLLADEKSLLERA